MTTTTLFIIFIPILATLLLTINLILAPHNPYQEKDSAFECGFHSFLGQNRTQFSVSFFIFGLLFLLFDLEILLVYPYSVSSYTNDIYGLVIMMVFFVLLTLGFIFELGKNALTIDSRQTSSYSEDDSTALFIFISDWSTTKMKRLEKLISYHYKRLFVADNSDRGCLEPVTRRERLRDLENDIEYIKLLKAYFNLQGKTYDMKNDPL